MNLTETALRSDVLKTRENLILRGGGDDEVLKTCENLIETSLRDGGDVSESPSTNHPKTPFHDHRSCGRTHVLWMSRAIVWKLPPWPRDRDERGKVSSSLRSDNRGPKCTRIEQQRICQPPR